MEFNDNELITKTSNLLYNLMSTASVPIAVPFSSGKDSTVLLNMVLTTASVLVCEGNVAPKILIFNANTGIEQPEIERHVQEELVLIRKYADMYNLDVEIHIAKPDFNNHFVMRVLSGRTLPIFPNSNTRDCTIDWKIKPMNKVRKRISERVMSETGYTPITMIATRFDESKSREKRMQGRGDDSSGVRVGFDGQLYMTPLADWDTDTIWLYLGLCRSGEIDSYSRFDDLFRIYADSSGVSCVVVAESLSDVKNSKPCQSRHGCYLCTAGEDRSMDNFIKTDSRYEYMLNINKLQKYILATQYDWQRRHWLGKTVDKNGFIKVAPNAYHPSMLIELLRYALTIDVLEKEAAIKLNLDAPRFELITPELLIGVDAAWSLYGLHQPFTALSAYNEIYNLSKRYVVPDINKVDETKMPDERYLYIGNDWLLNSDIYDGLRDPLLEEFGGVGCIGTTKLRNNAVVMDVNIDKLYSVNHESACMVLEYELETLLDETSRRCNAGITSGYMYYARMGILQLSKAQRTSVDRVIRRTHKMEELRLVGDYSISELLSRSISKSDMQEKYDVDRDEILVA